MNVFPASAPIEIKRLGFLAGLFFNVLKSLGSILRGPGSPICRDFPSPTLNPASLDYRCFPLMWSDGILFRLIS